MNVYTKIHSLQIKIDEKTTEAYVKSEIKEVNANTYNVVDREIKLTK